MDRSFKAFSFDSTTNFKLDFSVNVLYRSLLIDDSGSKTILTVGVLELKKPNTSIKMIGKRKLSGRIKNGKKMKNGEEVTEKEKKTEKLY